MRGQPVDAVTRGRLKIGAGQKFRKRELRLHRNLSASSGQSTTEATDRRTDHSSVRERTPLAAGRRLAAAVRPIALSCRARFVAASSARARSRPDVLRELACAARLANLPGWIRVLQYVSIEATTTRFDRNQIDADRREADPGVDDVPLSRTRSRTSMTRAARSRSTAILHPDVLGFRHCPHDRYGLLRVRARVPRARRYGFFAAPTTSGQQPTLRSSLDLLLERRARQRAGATTAVVAPPSPCQSPAPCRRTNQHQMRIVSSLTRPTTL